MFNTTSRPAGVQIPKGQRRSAAIPGTPKTVMHVVPAVMVAVQYADENGDVHDTMLVKVNNMVYHSPGGEQWAGQLKEASPWLAEAVSREVDSHSAPAPRDNVDVFPADEVSVAVQQTTEAIDAQNQKSPE